MVNCSPPAQENRKSINWIMKLVVFLQRSSPGTVSLVVLADEKITDQQEILTSSVIISTS